MHSILFVIPAYAVSVVGAVNMPHTRARSAANTHVQVHDTELS